MSYGVNVTDLFRRAAGSVAKILQGAQPADLPVERPTKFEFMVDLNTAKALGLTDATGPRRRGDRMITRRNLLAGLCALSPTRGYSAPPHGPPKRIGVLRFGTAPDSWFAEPFLSRLAVLGYRPGQNVFIEWRFAGGSIEMAQKLAHELVALKVDVIVAGVTPAAQAAKAATRTIPIVVQSGDAVRTGLVESLARPGGNITGTSAQVAELLAKGVEFLRELLPAGRVIGAFSYRGDPFAAVFIADAERVSRSVGFEFAPIDIAGGFDLDQAFEKAKRTGVEAILVPGVLRDDNAEVARLGRAHRIAVIGEHAGLVRAGGLLALGYDLTELTPRSAELVDKILNGASPADLPVEQPTRFLLSINLATAQALGILVPPTVLRRADEVIE
jgi:putative ABC transport system substrate-binding protein